MKRNLVILIIGGLILAFVINFIYNSIKITSYHISGSYVVNKSDDIHSFANDYNLDRLLYHDVDSCTDFSYSEFFKGELALEYQIKDTSVYLLYIPLDVTADIDISMRQAAPSHVRGLFMNPFKNLNALVRYNLEYDRGEKANNHLRITSDAKISEADRSFVAVHPKFIHIKNRKESIFYADFKTPLLTTCYVVFHSSSVAIKIYSVVREKDRSMIRN